MTMRCPGQDRRFWKPEDIFEEPCPHCGGSIEFWKDDVTVKCPHCSQIVPNPRFDAGCAAWCSYAEKCIGEVASVYQQQPAIVRNRLEAEVRKALMGKREALRRSLRAAEFAEQICRDEGAQPLVVIASCLLHQVVAGEGRHETAARDETAARASEILKRVVPDGEAADEILEIITHYDNGIPPTPNARMAKDAIKLAELEHKLRQESKSGDELKRWIRSTFETAAARRLAESLTTS